MIPGLEYEQPTTTNNNGVYSASSPSMQSVDMSPHNPSYGEGLHRRRLINGNNGYTNNGVSSSSYHTTPSKAKHLAKKLDLFPKLERDYEVRTEHGGRVTLLGYFVLVVLILAQVVEWRGENGRTVEGVRVDTRWVLLVLYV